MQSDIDEARPCSGALQRRLNHPWQFIRDGCISLAESGQQPDDLQYPSYHSAPDEVDTHGAFQ
jgi:hypothetical protein